MGFMVANIDFMVTSQFRTIKLTIHFRSIAFKIVIQSTLVISTSVISNNRLSRKENLIPVLT